MKRLTIIAVLLCSAHAFSHAQNNPYEIDDTCYEYFQMAEKLVVETGNDAFELANNALLKRAQETGDQKAVALHYVGRLKRVIRFARMMDDVSEANAKVESQRLETQQIARQTGYLQYFYYAYSLTQTYYVNTRQEIHAKSLLGEMMDVASKEQNEYGIWQSSIYIALLYQRQNDVLNARHNLVRAVNVYDRTSDPVIRRQSLTRQCCDLSSTYRTGSDSARFYLRKAEETARTHADTLRFMFYNAGLAAYDMQSRRYAECRDYCLSDPAFESVVGGGEKVLNCVDAILASAPLERVRVSADMVNTRPFMIYLRDLAIKYKREDVAARIGSALILAFYKDISFLNDMKIEETMALLHERQLDMKIARQNSIITVLGMALAVVAVLALLLAVLLIIKNHKTHNNQ